MNAIYEFEDLLAHDAPSPKLKPLLQAVASETIEADRLAKYYTDMAERGKTILKNVAIAELTPEVGPDLAGSAYTHIGLCGNTVNITFPEKSLIRGFFLARGNKFARFVDKTLVYMPNVRTLATVEGDDKFDVLFATNYKPAKAFRELAQRELPKTQATRIIEACEEPSSPRVSYATKTPAGGEPA